jgi:hypothetical protein
MTSPLARLRAHVLVVAVVVASVVVATCSFAPAAFAQAPPPPSKEDAGASWERGLTFFRDKDYVAAMVQFKRAYELDPNWMVLFNIGQTANELKSYAEALTALERYLKEGGDQVPAERRPKVEALVAELREKVAAVTVKTNVEGVNIAVDDVDVGVTPLAAPVRVNAGRRKFSALKEGYAPLTRFIEVAGNEQKEVSLDLVSLTGPGSNRPEQPEVKRTPWPWVGLGITGATGIATAVIGGLAFSKKSAFEDALNTFPTSSGAIEEARSEAKTFAVAADVLGGVTGGFAALTVIAFIGDYTRKPPKPGPNGEAPKPKAQIEPILSPGYIGVHSTF